MNFEKAYTELLAGRKIRRKEWEYYKHLRLVDGTVKTFHQETTSFYTNASVLITKEWTVIDGDGKKLSFIETLEPLKQKKGIRNDEMSEDSFIFIDSNNEFAMCKAVECQFMPTFRCLCSSDWEILK